MISILCPTRRRLDNVSQLVSSARDTADDEVQFVFYVDQDDRPSADLAWSLDCEVVMGSRIVLSQMWNECYKLSSSEINMHCGDDIVFRTKHWDSKVKAEFAKVPDRIILVHGDDGIHGEGLATHSFLHRNWTETLGYFVPPHFSSDYNDTWLTEIARRINRKVYIPTMYTEHMHPAVGKGQWDTTHRERLERHQRDNVEAIYSSLEQEREEDARKLQEFIVRF